MQHDDKINYRYPVEKWFGVSKVTWFPQTDATPEMFRLCFELSCSNETREDPNAIPSFAMIVEKSKEYFRVHKNVDEADLSKVMTSLHPKEIKKLLSLLEKHTKLLTNYKLKLNNQCIAKEYS